MKKSKVSVVIPSKNETTNIPRLLDALCQQEMNNKSMRIYIAEAGDQVSLRETLIDPEIARGVELTTSIIDGGLPATGRNNGANLVRSEYVVFMDADVLPGSPTLIKDALQLLENKNLDLVTTYVQCNNGGLLDQLVFLASNVVQKLSSRIFPFAPGMFMVWRTSAFKELRGFDEKALYAEDYLLSKKVHPSKFGIVPGMVLTSNRRFKKLGYGRVLWLFLKTALNSWNSKYFYKDQKYWDDAN